ncbi:hypothetical protein B0T16DRAFT_495270 [Cercophora newfieldiana]|uniref:Uncharacterized protein n=1 Tax=Cercophora newfieldiana TaxID=92897 RepID=A0AA40CP39_9PEZI|nr:hypothetical protein B0T16DRAFT_495270 [Cercophora newfieldiana]
MPSPNPEVIFVQSRITSPSLPPQPSTNASTPADELNTTGFPYLAIYPNLNLDWLSSPDCEFWTLPLHSDLLPAGGPGTSEAGGFVFDVSDFDMGGYEVVKTVGKREGSGAAKYVVVVTVGEGVVEGREGDLEGLLGESRGKLGVEGGTSTLVRMNFRKAEIPPREEEVRRGELFIGREYVVLHQIDSPPTDLEEQWGEKPILYNLIGGFGDVNSVLA